MVSFTKTDSPVLSGVKISTTADWALFRDYIRCCRPELFPELHDCVRDKGDTILTQNLCEPYQFFKKYWG